MVQKRVIIHVISGLRSGGAERALHNILRGGLASACKCIVVSLSDDGVYGERIRALGVPVYSMAIGRSGLSLSALWRFRRIVRQWQPDIIQGWMYHGNLAAWLGCRIASQRVVLAWNIRHCLYSFAHEKPRTVKVIRANRMLSRQPDSIVYNSQVSSEQHFDYGFSAASAQIIPNGFDVSRFSPDPAVRSANRQKLGISSDAIVIGHVGRFHPVKDHCRFVRAAARVASIRPNVEVIMCGGGVTQKNSELVSLVPRSMRSRFHWLGERDDIADLMRAMDLYCQSSLSEAFPNVLGEAMATSLPCVATDVGDSQLVLGATGVIVSPGDDDQLVNGLEEILCWSRERRHEIGAAARGRVSTEFALQAVVSQYVDMYERL